MRGFLAHKLGDQGLAKSSPFRAIILCLVSVNNVGEIEHRIFAKG